jgi:2-iminobutanoate/2-iminopropanoate deaminase
MPKATHLLILAAAVLVAAFTPIGMEKQIIRTTEAPEPIGPYSQAVLVGDMLYCSGQIAIDPFTNSLVTESLEKETEQVMENLAAVLKEAGMDFSNVVKTSIFLKSMDDFGTVNGIYGKHFEKDPPARETVEVSRLPKDVRVEISVVAAK